MAVTVGRVCRACGLVDGGPGSAWCGACLGPIDLVPTWSEPVTAASIATRHLPARARQPPCPRRTRRRAPTALEPVPGSIAISGGYDAVNRLSVEAAMAYEGWAWVNVGLRPWYVEGAATLPYETAEQLRWSVPDVVLAPIASGASLLRLHRAYTDLHAAGLLSVAPVVGSGWCSTSPQEPLRPRAGRRPLPSTRPWRRSSQPSPIT